MPRDSGRFAAALVIGCAMGTANNAYAEIISRMLDRTRRNHLLLSQEAVGAVPTVAATDHRRRPCTRSASGNRAASHLDVAFHRASRYGRAPSSWPPVPGRPPQPP